MSTTTSYRRHCPYTNEELLCRPLEHILEALSAKELAEALGMGHDAAWRIQQGRLPVTIFQEARIRAYLERLT